MTPVLDPADASILYDTARGFIGLKSPADVLRHALLSVMGLSGARLVIYLQRVPDDRFVSCALRGGPAEGEISFRLTARAGKHLVEDPGPHRVSRAEWLDARTRSLLGRHGIEMMVPVSVKGRIGGLLAVGPKFFGEPFMPRDESCLGAIAGMLGRALLADEPPAAAGRRRSSRTTTALNLRDEHPALRSIRGDGPATRTLLEEIVALSGFDYPVLLVGETGTGKELVARALHDLSPRAAEPFEAINCAAVPADLMPSALFGHERGAFTGAVSMARGAFERTGGGTLFLDEVGDMPLATQATLLRVLQEKQFRRVGGEKLIAAPARIISATNLDLPQAVKAGRFRADLFYRLQMAGIRLAPLRERREDIPRIVEHILEQQRPAGRRATVSADFLADLARRELPGNVRELEGLVLTALVRAGREGRLRAEHLPPEAAVSRSAPSRPTPEADPETPPSYQEMEREYIRSVLRMTGGNRKQAAALMGIPRTTLNARIRRLDPGGKI